MSKRSRANYDRTPVGDQQDSVQSPLPQDAFGLGILTGRKIVRIRNMTVEELREVGWSKRQAFPTKALLLDNGVLLFASCDPEGNGPGTIFGIGPNNIGFRVI